jgi:hypothetical protein
MQIVVLGSLREVDSRSGTVRARIAGDRERRSGGNAKDAIAPGNRRGRPTLDVAERITRLADAARGLRGTHALAQADGWESARDDMEIAL